MNCKDHGGNPEWAQSLSQSGGVTQPHGAVLHIPTLTRLYGSYPLLYKNQTAEKGCAIASCLGVYKNRHENQLITLLAIPHWVCIHPKTS